MSALRFFRSVDSEAATAAIAAMSGRRPPWTLPEVVVPSDERVSAIHHSRIVTRTVIEEDIRRGVECADRFRRYLED